jgi:hypothetical protein
MDRIIVANQALFSTTSSTIPNIDSPQHPGTNNMKPTQDLKDNDGIGRCNTTPPHFNNQRKPTSQERRGAGQAKRFRACDECRNRKTKVESLTTAVIE